MIDKKGLFEKVKILDDLAMEYEVAVQLLQEEDYLEEFYNFYEIKSRNLKLVPSEEDFAGSLKNLSGEYRWEAIAEKTKTLFGIPNRVLVFDDDDNAIIKDELEGDSGLAHFFFVFDIMFCEYEDYTLCFICGSNN